MKKSLKHIAISGNIGSGKTTLATALSQHYGWKLMLEKPQENPYLRDFYNDMHKWAFHAQIHFLSTRFTQAINILNNKVTVVQDRSIEEDANIFAANLFDSGILNARDYDTYQASFNTMMKFVRPPDLRVYLKADVRTLLNQIKKRSNDYEAAISHRYLESLNIKYEKWIDTCDKNSLLIIDMTKTDFVTSQADFRQITRLIDERISG
jgi:deoxyadenosine/deoxycytidine kinase